MHSCTETSRGAQDLSLAPSIAPSKVGQEQGIPPFLLFLTHPQLYPPQPSSPERVEILLESPALGAKFLRGVWTCTTLPLGLLRMCGLFLFCLADRRALSVFANTPSLFSQSPADPWQLCPGLTGGWAWGRRLPAGSHAPFRRLQESLPFSCRWEGGEIQLSGLGLGKRAAWALWPGLVLSC